MYIIHIHICITPASSPPDSIFKHNPDSMKLFVRVNVKDQTSPAFKAHCIRVINGLDSTIGLLSDPATLDVQLAHLALQHEERTGVTKAHFDVSNAPHRTAPHRPAHRTHSYLISGIL